MQITPLNPEDPSVLGDFELLGRIGHGGMGQVFLGESLGSEPAAVKVIKPSVVDSESRQRFAQEIEILKTVWGARLAAFLGADAEAEQPWLATEYVDGPDLARHVKDHGPLPSALTAALGAVLAEALSAVHGQGLLHRDLKPANVLLGPNGPKIIDFGLAAFTEASVALTAPHQVVGTPICMAPEQAAGVKPLTAAVDVYALGALLLFASTGHYPHEAVTPYMVFHLVTDPDSRPDLSGAPEDLVPLLTAMLAKNPEDRPSLTDVVQRCRSVIEAHGMKIAQARRKLTAHTARQPFKAVRSGESTTALWPAPVSDVAGTEITPPTSIRRPSPRSPSRPPPNSTCPDRTRRRQRRAPALRSRVRPHRPTAPVAGCRRRAAHPPGPGGRRRRRPRSGIPCRRAGRPSVFAPRTRPRPPSDASRGTPYVS